MPISIRDGGAWKTALPYVRDGGVWKQPIVYIKDGGVWKLAHSNASVSISQTSQFASGSSSSFFFPTVTVTVTGGTASSYNWYFNEAFGGLWSIGSGQGTATASAFVSSVPGFQLAEASLRCDVVVNGQTFTVACVHSYYNEGSGLPEF